MNVAKDPKRDVEVISDAYVDLSFALCSGICAPTLPKAACRVELEFDFPGSMDIRTLCEAEDVGR
ncbi:hypothetical protein [Methylobacterium oxalidis]|uniref:hypothetical protein n=1 Tax=Methylobacterium oxalidis TaxID=944322 RepID=UPI0033145A85